jgi:hypothetical protein
MIRSVPSEECFPAPGKHQNHNSDKRDPHHKTHEIRGKPIRAFLPANPEAATHIHFQYQKFKSQTRGAPEESSPTPTAP